MWNAAYGIRDENTLAGAASVLISTRKYGINLIIRDGKRDE